MSLFNQLAGSLLQTSGRSSRSLFEGSVALATDVGVVRNENQDRVVFARILAQGHDAPINIAVVSDGMGGMADGAICASLAIAGLIDAIAGEPSSNSLEYSLEHAAHAANEAVYREFSGKGGATLSAIAWQKDRDIVTLNVGDSRIYHQAGKPTDDLQRLTVDDTMSEAFGGEGKGLIQFMGLGKGLKPHVKRASRSGMVFATTDGVHFINHETMQKVLSNAETAKSKADRTIALARWLGGPDNASIAVIDLDAFPVQTHFGETRTEVWPCGAEQTCIWMTQPNPKPRSTNNDSDIDKPPLKRKQKRNVKRKSAAERAKEEAQGQLEIEVETDEGHEADS